MLANAELEKYIGKGSTRLYCIVCDGKNLNVLYFDADKFHRGENRLE